MSGHRRDAATDEVLADLPGQRRSIVHILRLGFRFEPALLWISLGTTLLGALPDALVALWTDGAFVPWADAYAPGSMRRLSRRCRLRRGR